MPAGFDHSRGFGMEVGRIEADNPGKSLAVRESAVLGHQLVGMLRRNLDMIAEHSVVPDAE